MRAALEVATSRALLVMLLAACSPLHLDPPLSPFQIPAWTTLPTDDEIVRAIVGTGGSADERTDAESVTRDLLLPKLRKDRELRALLWSLELMKDFYETMKGWEPRDAFLRFAISEAVGDLGGKAAGFADVRLKNALWPNEPFPEEWETSATIDAATVTSAVAALERRMKELEARYGGRLPLQFAEEAPPLGTVEYGEHRTIALARNHLHVALTGDYTVTSGSIYTVLSKRGIATRQHPSYAPY